LTLTFVVKVVTSNRKIVLFKGKTKIKMSFIWGINDDAIY